MSDLSREERFQLIVDGMFAMRTDLGLENLPPRLDEVAALWTAAQRPKDELEADIWENVWDGRMWADWTPSGVVFRLTPAGIQHVEDLMAQSGLSEKEFFESYGIDTDRDDSTPKAELS